MKRRLHKLNAFTLIELLVCFVIIGIVITLVVKVSGMALEKSRLAQCSGNLRNIGLALHARAQDNNGIMYTLEDIGFSKYRRVNDPMGLAEVLKPYGADEGVWDSPVGADILKDFGNDYQWSVATNVTSQNIYFFENIHATPLAWRNYQHTLPSVYNRREHEVSKGPKAAPAQYRKSLLSKSQIVNMLYADGHVVPRLQKY